MLMVLIHLKDINPETQTPKNGIAGISYPVTPACNLLKVM